MARTRLYPPSVDPGFPELAPTPAGWSRSTFGDVVEVVSRPVKLQPEERYRLVNAKRSRGGVVLRGEALGREVKTKTQFEARSGDFLISRRQIIHGACGVVPDELDGAVVSNEYSTLRTRPALLMDFLRHYSHTPYFQRTCFHSSHGVDVEKMIFKINEWLVREVDLPPLPEQRKIAAILSSVDEVIEKTEAVIESLQTVKKAMMQELLTRGLPGRHTRFKQTEIGEIPEGWEVARTDAVGAVAYGLTVNKARRSSAKRHPYLTVANLQEHGFVLDQVKEIGVVDGDERYECRDGDVLLVEGNANPARLGRAAVWRNEIPGAMHQNHLIRVRPNQAAVSPDWLASSINSATGRSQIELAAKTSSGLHTINSKVVASLLVPLPPLAEQNAVMARLSSCDARRRAEEQALNRLTEVKAALMSVLLTGELRVTPDEDAA